MKLTLRSDGRYAAKLAGKYLYFGRDFAVAQDKLALTLDRLAKGEVQPAEEGFTVGLVIYHFLQRKRWALKSQAIKPETFAAYEAVTTTISHLFQHRLVESLTVPDFDRLRAVLSAKSPQTTKVRLGIARMVLAYAGEVGDLVRPLRFRNALKPPSAKEMRISRAARGDRLLTPDKIRQLLDTARGPLRSMIFLGLNCGLGNHDCCELTPACISGEWLHYARPKTGNDRRAWLWPETREGLTLPFSGWTTERISKAFAVLTKPLGIKHTFYDLRRTFATIAGEAGEAATSYVMGHVPDSRDMSAIYRQGFSDARVRAVCEHMRAHIYPG